MQIPHQAGGNVAILDVFYTRKDLLNILPVHDISFTKVVANDFFDGRRPTQAKRLSPFHC